MYNLSNLPLLQTKVLIYQKKKKKRNLKQIIREEYEVLAQTSIG